MGVSYPICNVYASAWTILHKYPTYLDSKDCNGLKRAEDERIVCANREMEIRAKSKYLRLLRSDGDIKKEKLLKRTFHLKSCKIY